MAATDFSVAISGKDIPEESVLLARLREALARGQRKVNIINGYNVVTDSTVRMLTGPVLGDVTESSAIILLEVSSADKTKKVIPVTCDLYKGDNKGEPVFKVEMHAPAKNPVVFEFSGLQPGTRYTAVFNGVCKFNATNRMATFQTKSKDIRSFRILALSCDRPSRLLMGQKDPWRHMLRRSKNVDVVLHVGDQIYPDNEDIGHADNIFNTSFDRIPEKRQAKMMARARELWREKYRTVFSREGKMEMLAKVSNLMIWSDNDVANDFTTMKNADGSQKYHPNFLTCGMMAYREYQRCLWDPKCSETLEGEVREWHSHVYGPVGIFFFDLRGNRITSSGRQMSENCLLSDAQWTDVEAFFRTPGLRAIVLCSETPFIGDEPAVCKKKVQDSSSMDFLRDHWPFNEDELVRLLDLSFKWKQDGEESGAGRELMMIGGDIHCGVTSVIRDEDTGMQINHLTTSPVTNHVCKFFPPAQGKISSRYNFSHLPLGEKFRNYADVSITIGEEEVDIQAKLVPISTDIFKDASWDVAAESVED